MTYEKLHFMVCHPNYVYFQIILTVFDLYSSIFRLNEYNKIICKSILKNKYTVPTTCTISTNISFHSW